MPDRRGARGGGGGDAPADARSGEEQLAAAADVLYRTPPEQFVAERDRLVREARAAGDRDHARAVGGLGRPTRAAWVLNLLARDAPDVVGPLVDLGAALREAQHDLDAAALRTLSDQRRALAREVAAQAFDLAGEEQPSAALRAEVQDTLTAAVVDPDVGAALRSGRLLKVARASGFGPAGPALAAVPAPPARAATARPARAARTSPPAGESPAVARERRAAERERARQEREEARRAEREAAERRRRVETAERALHHARDALEQARADEADARERVRILSEQLADARRTTGDAGLAVRQAQADVREAERAHRAALSP